MFPRATRTLQLVAPAALAALIALPGCGGSAHEPLLPEETFTWCPQAISFSPPPSRWYREGDNGGGTLGVRFILRDGGGQCISLAAYTSFAERDRRRALARLAGRRDSLEQREFLHQVSLARARTDDPLSDREGAASLAVNAALDRAVEHELGGQPGFVAMDLDEAYRAASSYEMTLPEILQRIRLHPERMQEPDRWRLGYERDTLIAGQPAFAGDDTLVTPERPLLYTRCSGSSAAAPSRRSTRARRRTCRCSIACSRPCDFRSRRVLLRAEAGFAALAAALLSLGACAPAPRELEIGAHRVRLVPPAGWEILAQGQQSFVRRGEISISLTDAGPASAPGFERELRAARAIWLAGRRQDAFARVRTLGGPPLRFATSDQRAEFWRAWNDVAYRAEAADSASIGLAFDDLLRGSRRLPRVAPASLDEFVLERWSDAARREIHARRTPIVHGRAWTEITTWSRVSHLDPRPVAYLDDDGYLLIVGVEHGDPALAGPAFERMMPTIEVVPDTTLAR